VSALVNVVEPLEDVAARKLLPWLIDALKRHVPDGLIAVAVELETVHESVVLVAKVIVPSPEPADGVEITVRVSPYFIGEAGAVTVIVRIARLIVRVAVSIVTAVYESSNELGVTGVIEYVPAFIGFVLVDP
jgi:hypothetical protein